MNQETVGKFISTFELLKEFQCLPAIDAMFLKLLYEDWKNESFETNKSLIVTFCRANADIRDLLDFYEPFLEKSIKYCEDNNFDPSKILKGII